MSTAAAQSPSTPLPGGAGESAGCPRRRLTAGLSGVIELRARFIEKRCVRRAQGSLIFRATELNTLLHKGMHIVFDHPNLARSRGTLGHSNRVGPKGQFGKCLLRLLKSCPIRPRIKRTRNGVRERHVLAPEISFNAGGRFKLDLGRHERPALSEVGLGTTELEVINIDNQHQVQLRMPKHALPIFGRCSNPTDLRAFSQCCSQNPPASDVHRGPGQNQTHNWIMILTMPFGKPSLLG